MSPPSFFPAPDLLCFRPPPLVLVRQGAREGAFPAVLVATAARELAATAVEAFQAALGSHRGGRRRCDLARPGPRRGLPVRATRRRHTLASQLVPRPCPLTPSFTSTLQPSSRSAAAVIPNPPALRAPPRPCSRCAPGPPPSPAPPPRARSAVGARPSARRRRRRPEVHRRPAGRCRRVEERRGK